MATILDNLFSEAGSGFTAVCNYTTNQTGGLSSRLNNSSAPPDVQLVYTPEQIIGSGKFKDYIPAYFSGPSIKITGKTPVSINYWVEILGAGGFVPTVDPTTNIIYGAAGSVFVTISLCDLQPPGK